MKSQFKVGDRVRVKAGKAHDAMTNGKVGTVKQISTPALGIQFDGMTELHKWYVDDELDSQDSDVREIARSTAEAIQTAVSAMSSKMKMR